MRKLYYIQEFHDLVGSFSDSKLSEYFDGNEELNYFKDRYYRLNKENWNSIKEAIKKEDLNYSNLNIFVDNQVSPKESIKSYRKNSKKGSLSDNFIVGIVKKGGILKKTEKMDLIRRQVKDATDFDATSKRDMYIADRINKHLKDTGILIMGAIHNPIQYLNDDIQVHVISNQKHLEKLDEFTYTWLVRRWI